MIQEKICHTPIIKNKVFFYYDSTKLLNVDIVTKIWNEIIKNYKNQLTIEFITIDINNNKDYSDVTFNVLPMIYFINSNKNQIFNYPNELELNYSNVNNFIINSHNK